MEGERKHIAHAANTTGSTLGMCISITKADAIRISMHSQRYDTLNIHMKQLAIQCNLMRYDTIHSYYDAARLNLNSIQHNVIRCNGKKYDLFIYLVQTDSKS